MAKDLNSLTLKALCAATRNTLAAIAHQYNDRAPITHGGGALPAKQAVELVAKLNNATAANQAIMAMKGLHDHVDPNHPVPLYEALGRLIVDGVCGPRCATVAELIDQTINHEAAMKD